MATTVKPRTARLALVAVAAVILGFVAMCHSSDTDTGNAAKPTVPAAAAPPTGAWCR
ncbi:hypothetical protein [Mycobacterium scrofulaceum]|uniref:hypothetical protein n=1 Tax=Mycobacterium scrofulaceum TaxID=1783 RepID=UPI0018D47A05|nr:hypothetical protein [Mycobacterium scrofulaceum]